MGLFDEYEKADDLYRKKDNEWVGVVIAIIMIIGAFVLFA